MSRKENGCVPKLRFPEFGGEWENMPIGDLLREKLRPIAMDDETDYSLVTVKRRYGGIVSRGVLKGSSILVKSQFLLHENDFLISKRQIVHNACGVVPKEFEGSIVSNEYSILKPRNNCDIAFINYFSQQPIVSQSFLQSSIGIVIEKMLFNLNYWLKKRFLFPTLPEQQKIAACLTSLDSLISMESQKLDSLKEHKKGLMQNLFPAEGETVPKLRFPEFRRAGEWKATKLDKVVSYENGKAHENDIAETGKFVVVNSKFISTEGEVRKYTDHGFCIANAGDVLMVLSDVPNGRAIAKCYLVVSENCFTVNQRICKLTPKKIIGKMLFYTVNRNPYFLAFDDGIKQTNLRKEEVLECPIFLPPLPEQQKISSTLTSLDNLITAQTQKIEALKSHKKGLMQQLFPAATSGYKSEIHHPALSGHPSKKGGE